MFKHVGVNKPLAVDEPPLNIMEEVSSFAKMLSHESHLFINKKIFEKY